MSFLYWVCDDGADPNHVNGGYFGVSEDPLTWNFPSFRAGLVS